MTDANGGIALGPGEWYRGDAWIALDEYGAKRVHCRPRETYRLGGPEARRALAALRGLHGGPIDAQIVAFVSAFGPLVAFEQWLQEHVLIRD